MRTIVIGDPAPARCAGCSSKVNCRPVTIGETTLAMCSLCRSSLRQALAQVAVVLRDEAAA